MVPGSFLFLNALPLTPNGKVNRKGLPKPEGGQRESEQPYLPPQSEMEQAIASIWQKVLHLEQVGVQDNFFDLGGHSLSMARVHSQLIEVLKTEISMVELFQYPTIAALSEGLRNKQAALDSQSMPMKESEGLPHPGDRLKESSMTRAQKQKAALERQRTLKQQQKS
jgi:acyl carrier protein